MCACGSLELALAAFLLASVRNKEIVVNKATDAESSVTL